MEGKFFKYPSIENLYNIANDEDFFARLNEYRGEWIVTEKIDGSNISFIITADEIRVGSRNGILPEGSREVYEAVERTRYIRPRLRDVQWWIRDNDTNIDQVTLFGEYFGPGIQNRIFYGCKKEVRLFDVLICGRGEVFLMSPAEAVNALETWHIGDLYVPILLKTNSFESAKNYPTINRTTFGDHKSIMEGVVIRPWWYTAWMRDGEFRTLMVKNKNELFQEMHRAGVRKFDPSQPIVALHEAFLSLITENRMYSVFSKMGAPTARDQIGKYISAFVEDAKEEFLKVHADELKEYTKADERYVFDAGKEPFYIFKRVAKNINCKVEF